MKYFKDWDRLIQYGTLLLIDRLEHLNWVSVHRGKSATATEEFIEFLIGPVEVNIALLLSGSIGRSRYFFHLQWLKYRDPIVDGIEEA
jgi:hypothetical protein